MIQPILDKAIAGERLTSGEGLTLLQSNDLAAIGRAADAVTRRLHPEPIRTYNIDRNINYTNICTAVCDFCAFYRKPKHAEGYVLPREELLQKVKETVELGGDQILMQGGLHPDFDLVWYEELLADIKSHFPQVNLHAFSPPELHAFTKINKLPIRTVLERLKAAGLGSIPGGGAEILVDRVRKEITRGKVLTDDWLNVMRVWHELGGVSSVTMMFGHVETLAERIEHLERVRQLQDETHGFTAFICWTFQPEHTDMAHIPPAGSFDYLKTQAVSRLYLDNILNIQSSWVTQGLKIGQLALLFGANDMGSLMIEENVVAEAGTVHFLTLDQIRGAIEELGFTPRQRNVRYELFPLDHERRAIEANRQKLELPLVQLASEAMPHGYVSEIIPAPSTAAFDLLHDYQRRLEWDPLLSAAYLTDGFTKAELGAASVCVGRRLLGALALKTVYVAFDRPRLAAVKMVNRPPFFANWAASIRHEDLSENQSRVTYTWTFSARPRWCAWVLEPLMNCVFRRETRKRLRALQAAFAVQNSLAAGRSADV